MLSTILTFLIVGLPKAGYILLLFLWWTHRKENNLACIPWILLAYFLGFVTQTIYTMLTKSHHPMVVFQSYVFTMPNVSVYVRVIGAGVAEFICIFMIASNITFLTDKSSSTTGLIRFVRDQYACHRIWGIVLLVIKLSIPLFLIILFLNHVSVP